MAAADAVIAVAMAQRGKPYVFGKQGPDSFDCSGLCVYAFKLGAGLSLPHFTGALWAKYPHTAKTDIQPGDLIFPTPSHVGIAIGNGQMVVAPHTGTVVQVQKIGTIWGVARIIAPGTAVTVGPTPGGITNVVDVFPGQSQLDAIANVFQQVGSITDTVTNPQNVMRAAIATAGLLLVIIGVVKIEHLATLTRKVVSSVT